jgi:hypothetical protein
VCMLAHQLGFLLANEAAYGMWNWEKLWKECGASGGPGYDSEGMAPRRSPRGELLAVGKHILMIWVK